MEPFPSWGEPERRTGKASGAGGAGRIEDYRRGSVMSDIMPSLSRRTFMKTTGALGALAAVGGSVAATNTLFGAGVPQAHAAAEETVTWGHCAINCPGRCSLKFHVQDDEVVWVDTYTSKDAGFDDPQPRACLRGRTYRRWLANPDRINYPMKRAGKRGEGKFEQISWDEAVDTIASELKRIIDEYGNESVYIPYATGVSSTTARSLPRFMNCIGGCLGSYGDYSAMQMEMIVPHTYGASGFSGSTLNAAEDAALILAFGTSPTETRQGGAVSHYDWVHLRETTKGKMIYIDPRMNDSVMGRSAEWQPINPGTDAALCSAIAHELIANDQVDKEFLDAYCVGFDEDTMPESAKGQNKSYKDYIMGTGYDMVEKTAEWAAPITGIPAERIKQLAADIAAAEAPFICQGWGPQRHTNGEDTSRAICMLPVLIGKIGLPGTNTGQREAEPPTYLVGSLPFENPIKTAIPVYQWINAVDHGKEMTATNAGIVGADKLNNDIKFLWNYAGNCITNQHGDINYTHDVLADESKLEFILVWDTVMTDSAKYADILLPDAMRSEQLNMQTQGYSEYYTAVVVGGPAQEAPGECRSSYDVCADIADKFGKKDAFTEGKTQEDWIKELYEAGAKADGNMPTWDEIKAQGHYKRELEPVIGLADFVADPAKNPLETPSGKIEIYAERLAEDAAKLELAEGDVVTPIPVFDPGYLGYGSTTDEFPLYASGFHYKSRTHSSYGGVEELNQACRQQIWINDLDAQAGEPARAVDEPAGRQRAQH